MEEIAYFCAIVAIFSLFMVIKTYQKRRKMDLLLIV